MHATCPAHLILLALITLTILGEEYKPWFNTTEKKHPETQEHYVFTVSSSFKAIRQYFTRPFCMNIK
jgi:hypothetical protein